MEVAGSGPEADTSEDEVLTRPKVCRTLQSSFFFMKHLSALNRVHVILLLLVGTVC